MLYEWLLGLTIVKFIESKNVPIYPKNLIIFLLTTHIQCPILPQLVQERCVPITKVTKTNEIS